MEKNKTGLVFGMTIIMTIMEMTGLPTGLLVNIKIADIEPIYFVLMINFVLAWIICWLWHRYLCKDWSFGLQKQGIGPGLKGYGMPALLAAVIVFFAFCVGLAPLDNRPTIWRVVIEGVVYYIGVGIMEEVYLRGLLQNIIEKLCRKKKNAVFYAVFITSFLFGAGHIFGALGQPALTVICKVLWAMALGVYFGAVYICTRNLWVPIILHTLIDLSGIPFCFTTTNQYPTAGLLACLGCYLCLGGYGVYILRKKMKG